MNYVRRAGASLALAVVIAACANQTLPPGLSADQVLSNGVRAFQKLTSTHVTAKFTIDQTTGTAIASVLHGGEVAGTVTLGSETSPFVYVDGTSFFETNAVFVIPLDSGIYSIASSIKGRPWWRTSGTAPVAQVVRLLSTGLISTFLTGREHLTPTLDKDSRKRAAIRLSDSAGTVYVARTSPYQILEVKSAPHYLAGGFSDVDIVFDDINAPVTVTAPTNFVTPDVADMPLYPVVESADFGDCDESGCTVKASIGARAGSGIATVTLTVSASSDGERLATCTTTVALAHYDDIQTATCHAEGSALDGLVDSRRRRLSPPRGGR